MPLQRMAFDEFMHKTRLAPSAQTLRHSRQIFNRLIERRLPIRQPAAEPSKREAKKARPPPQLENHLSTRPVIETSRSKKIMLECENMLIHAISKIDGHRHLLTPECS